MGSDRFQDASCLLWQHFNPRSPDGKRRPPSGSCRHARDFNPRSPDGKRPSSIPYRHIASEFQSTLPGWEATSVTVDKLAANSVFQSTLPGWEATMAEFVFLHSVTISIHAPRMGSDVSSILYSFVPLEFQSTLPGWEATACVSTPPSSVTVFQSTLPGWEATCRKPPADGSGLNFNPRSPDGKRRSGDSGYIRWDKFQSTLPGWEATAKMDIFAHDMGKIIHFQH